MINENIDTVLIVLLVGIVIGTLLSNALKKHIYERRKRRWLQTIEEREEWIKFLEKQIPTA
jgi:hypothetical protein